MKTKLNSLIAALLWPHVMRRGSNSEPISLADVAEGAESLSASNAAAGDVGDGSEWHLPYGSYTEAPGVTQIFDREAAETMAGIKSGANSIIIDNIKRLLPKSWKWVHGRDPIITIGHPFDPRFPNDKDESSYGNVTRIVAGANGATFTVELNEAGKALVGDKRYTMFTPEWDMIKVGPGMYRPCALKNIGLTNRGNIPDAILPGCNADLPSDPAKKAAEAEAEAEESAEGKPDVETAKETEAETSTEIADLVKVSQALALPDTSTLADVLKKISETMTLIAGYEQDAARRITEAVQAAEADKVAAQSASNSALEQVNVLSASNATLAADRTQAEARVASLQEACDALARSYAGHKLEVLCGANKVLPFEREDRLNELLSAANGTPTVQTIDDVFARLNKLPRRLPGRAESILLGNATIVSGANANVHDIADGSELVVQNNQRRAAFDAAYERHKRTGSPDPHGTAWREVSRTHPHLM